MRIWCKKVLAEGLKWQDGLKKKGFPWLKNQRGGKCQLRSGAEHAKADRGRDEAKGGKELTRPRDITQDLRARRLGFD